ncbi:MAG: hypothetical protein J0I77_21400 [Rudaea sp.]|uniref:hypothetical protein n=1 Tax=unclassified Rudaea TaxID=2627037 RepID=UPI0010F9FCDB|nr:MULTISPECIES: hypothetical protein [unclassified Rudaea]MBN8888283.1 hypothetical protein [Rudaea sp.]
MFERTLRRVAQGMLAAVFLAFARTTLAQTPSPLAQPDLNLYTNGTVYAAVRLPDGSVVFGGSFLQVNGVARSNIARLKADGTLDLNWNPGADRTVKALTIDTQNRLYVGGYFQTIAGAQHNQVARFATDGTIDGKWTANLSCNNIYALASNSHGDLIVGGQACSVDGSLVATAKLAGDTGALIHSWKPGVLDRVTALVVAGNDDLYLGGSFTQVGGLARNHLAKISSLGAGVVDPNWNPAPTNTIGDVQIFSIVPDNGGNVLIGGSFTSIGGQNRNNIARLFSSDAGNADAGWNPSANGTVNALSIDSSGRTYAAGAFSTIGGQAKPAVARLLVTGSGTADPTWPAVAGNIDGGAVRSLVANNDGNVYVGGFFSTIAGAERHSFTAIGSNGIVRPALDTVTPGGIVKAIVKQSNGGMIVGGYFSGADNFARSNVLRLQSDGSVDPNWLVSTDAPNSLGVEAIAIGSDNAIYLGGEFSKVNGQAKSGVVKLTPSGALDPNWGAASDVGGIAYYGVEALALAADGSVYVGGDFSSVGGQPRSSLAKISNRGVVDPTWNPNQDAAAYPTPDFGVTAIAIDPDGSLYVASDSLKLAQSPVNRRLLKVSGQGIGPVDQNWNPSLPWVSLPFSLLLDGKGYLYAGGSGIAKISTKDGVADPNWRPQMLGQLSFQDSRQGRSLPQIYSLALDGSGNLYAGGMFSIVLHTVETPTSYYISDQHPRPYLVKMSTTGAAEIDPAWNPTPNEVVNAIVTAADGRLYVGGAFSQIGGQSRQGVASLPSMPASATGIPDHLNQFGWTGAWYNPATSGQGMLLQIIPGPTPSDTGTFFGAWFTYDQFGGGQRWYTFQGPVDNTSKAVGMPVYAGASAEGSTITTVNVGDALVSFSDCTHASVAYSIYDPMSTFSSGFGRGNYLEGGFFPLVRLGANISCTATGDVAADPDYQLSGMWYDPKVPLSGLMFLVDPTSKVFFAGWFKQNFPYVLPPFDVLTSRRWYSLQGPWTSGATSLDNVPIYWTKDGVLNQPVPITSMQVGTAKLVFANCNSVTLAYTFTGGPDAGTSGMLNLSRGVGKPANCNP